MEISLDVANATPRRLRVLFAVMLTFALRPLVCRWCYHTSGPNTNGSQFFINMVDTPHLYAPPPPFFVVVKKTIYPLVHFKTCCDRGLFRWNSSVLTSIAYPILTTLSTILKGRKARCVWPDYRRVCLLSKAYFLTTLKTASPQNNFFIFV